MIYLMIRILHGMVPLTTLYMRFHSKRLVTIPSSKILTIQDVKHHVFEDYRYAVTFFNVNHPAEVLSSALGSLFGQTNCRCKFQWHFNVGQIAASQCHLS